VKRVVGAEGLLYHLQTGKQGGIYRKIYTPREATREAYTRLYPPREASREVYTRIYTQGG